MLALSLQTVVLAFGMPCNFFLIARHVVLYQVKRTVINRPLVMWWQVMQGGEVFYSPMIRSRSFIGPMALD